MFQLSLSRVIAKLSSSVTSRIAARPDAAAACQVLSCTCRDASTPILDSVLVPDKAQHQK